MSGALKWYGGGTYAGMGPTADAAAQATNRASTLGGRTAGTAATTATGGNDDPTSRALAVGAKGNPIVALLVAFAIFIGLWYGVHKIDGGEDRRIIPFTASNFVVNGMGALLFIYIVKNIVTRWPIPGFTTVAHTI